MVIESYFSQVDLIFIICYRLHSFTFCLKTISFLLLAALLPSSWAGCHLCYNFGHEFLFIFYGINVRCLPQNWFSLANESKWFLFFDNPVTKWREWIVSLTKMQEAWVWAWKTDGLGLNSSFIIHYYLLAVCLLVTYLTILCLLGFPVCEMDRKATT